MIYYIGKWDNLHISYNTAVMKGSIILSERGVLSRFNPISKSLLLKAANREKDEDLRSFLISRLKEIL